MSFCWQRLTGRCGPLGVTVYWRVLARDRARAACGIAHLGLGLSDAAEADREQGAALDAMEGFG